MSVRYKNFSRQNKVKKIVYSSYQYKNIRKIFYKKKRTIENTMGVENGELILTAQSGDMRD